MYIPSCRYKLQYDYTNGIPTAIKDFNAPTTVIWSRTANDARGDVIDETLGSNLKVVTGRDLLTGRMDYRQPGVGGGTGIQNLVYLYDVNDNLTQRGDANQTGSCSVGGIGSKLCETFTYDSLDRLDTVRRNGTLTLDANYDLSGNLSSRSDVGSYTYHATKKHAVTAAGSNSFAYDANGNVITRNGATLGWASYDLPTSLASSGNTASFAYGPDRARWRQIAVTAGVTETTIYVAGILEKVTKPSITLWKHYVASPTGMGAVYVRRSDGTSDTYYLTTDQLGSTDRILKAATGTVQVAESFDAFGKRRGSDWQGGPSAADLTAIGNSTPDGFTGHEMLDGVGLIHMGGRVYDPSVGRFLGVDPIVRDASASQAWNGYGYVEGHLLSATDPSGYSACPGRMSGDSCDIRPEESWKRERMLSRDSYRSIGGYWIGDNSPAWRFDTGVEGIGVAARNPTWVSTGFSWGMLGQANVGQGAGMRDMPSQPASEPADVASRQDANATLEEVIIDVVAKHKKCLAESYGRAFDVAYDLSPFAVVGTIVESAATEVAEDMLARQANRNKYAGAGRRLGAVGSRQMRTLVQFRYFNAGMTVASAAATGVVIGANIFCGYSGL